MVEIVLKMSTLHIHKRGTVFNHSHYGYCKPFSGLITSYHMLDAMVRGMFTSPTEVAFTNTNINTISGVLCISDTLV